MIDLKTDNIPFWTTISRFMQFFESEHKVGIYFFKTSNILDQKWGTSSAIKYQDPHYKFPVGLRAFGNYSYRIFNPQDFFVNVVGAHNDFYAEDFRKVMGARLMQPIADYLATSGFSYTDIDANREEITAGLYNKLSEAFSKLGFELTDFGIEGTSFDEDTLKRINRIADMTAEAQAAQAVGLDYARMQQLEAMRDAAKNEGGAAGLGMSLAAGMGFGQTMASAFNQAPPQTAAPLDNTDEAMLKLKKLKQLFEAQLISSEEYAAKKQEILATL
jgi:membrane protease subunit (stomatin/prohibitin family)